jgi:uncharacterized repeat protein (TIGR02543 family)
VDLGDSSMRAGGEIGSNPAGIDCVADYACLGFFSWQHAFAAGTVTLTATPRDGWGFAGWSGDGCSGTGTCQVQMSGGVSDDQQVTAKFVIGPATLIVRKAGSGAGTVTSSPAGIECGADCTHVFADGPTVTLTAQPSRHSRFKGWSGSGCGGRGVCTVPMNATRLVTATFQRFCVVPRVKGLTLRAARERIRRAHCRAGTIKRSYSSIDKGHVVSQRPGANRRIRSGAKVNLVVSKGRRP